MSGTSTAHAPAKTLPSDLGYGDEFVVCDEQVPEAFPAVYRFERCIKDGIGQVRNQRSGQVLYLVYLMNAMDDGVVVTRDADIGLIPVMVTARTLYTLSSLRAFNDRMR